MPKSRGSGGFSILIGIGFISLMWKPCGIDLVQFDRSTVITIWYGFAALILLFWGIQRVLKPDAQSPFISQKTFNFVVTIVGVTLALISLK